MEITTLFYSSKLTKPPLCCSGHQLPSLFHSKASVVLTHNSINSLGFKSSTRFQLQGAEIKTRRNGYFGVTHATKDESQSSVEVAEAERWLLEPVGDGDWRHIGFKVPMPNAFEIASSLVTVGRVPEKADMVIPVATVSSLHARIQNTEGSLLVTDLDSTNGTFIDEKRLRPGAATIISPGSCITFGDTHLAMFRVSKIYVEATREVEELEVRDGPDY